MVPQCPWCKRTFPTWPLAKIHVKDCERSPRPRWKRRTTRVQRHSERQNERKLTGEQQRSREQSQE
jgi:hypothetical protein